MSLRIFQISRKWQQLCCVTQRFYYKPDSAICSYATIANDFKHLTGERSKYGILNKWKTPQKLFECNSSTAVNKDFDTKSPALSSLLEKLMTQLKNYGQLNSELWKIIITQLENTSNVYNEFLTEDNAHFLLRACGTQMPTQRSNVRLELFQRFWTYLAQHSKLKPAYYVTWLQVLQYNRAPISDFRVFLQQFNELNNNNYAPSEIYPELLNTLCDSGDMKQVTELLAEMRKQELPLTERHFNALVVGNIRNNDLAGCRSVLDNMAAAGIIPSLETQSILVSAYLENEEWEKAKELLQKYHRKFNVDQVMRILRSILYVKTQPEGELIKLLVLELPKDFAEGEEVALPLRHLCIELLYNGNIATVKHIILSLPTPIFNENQDIDTFGLFLLQELFRAGYETKDIIEVANMLQESNKNTRALHIATELALRRGSESAFSLLECLSKQEPLRPHYFWPLILQRRQHTGEAGIINTLKEMKYLNVTCDHETIALYVLPNIPVTLQSPEKTMRLLDSVGLKPSLVMVHIIKYLVMQQRLDAAHDLLELYPTKFLVEPLIPELANSAVNVRATRRYQQFAKLLSALSKKNENQKVDWVGQLLLNMVQRQKRLTNDLRALKRFIDEMIKYGLMISPAALRTIMSLLEEQTDKDVNLMHIKEALNKISDSSVVLLQNATNGGIGVSSSFAKHPRDMSREELECHLIELEGKDMNVRGVLRRLLQLCVRDEHLERALEIKSKCDKLRVQVSAGMLASIFDLYIKLKDLPNAEKTLQRIQKEFPAFTIDEHKLIDYAALLVHDKRLDAAKQLLQERAATMKIHGGDYVIKNVWNFLTNIAKLAAQMPELEPEQNLTRENFYFLQKLRYCNAHNAVLGPIVREPLLRGDIRRAVVEFSNLAKRYKHTPLQFELLSLLVRLSNGHEDAVKQYGNISSEEAQQLLSDVTDSIAKVHGSLNMNSGLLLAFAQSGTDNQLRRLLINPEFRINDDLLLKNCEHLGEEGAVETLLRLARGARGFGRVINEQNIYNMLLTHFAKANNYEAALDLYERLEMDDELKISQEFLQNLVQLLRVNNVEIPSRVALQAQIM